MDVTPGVRHFAHLREDIAHRMRYGGGIASQVR